MALLTSRIILICFGVIAAMLASRHGHSYKSALYVGSMVDYSLALSCYVLILTCYVGYASWICFTHFGDGASVTFPANGVLCRMLALTVGWFIDRKIGTTVPVSFPLRLVFRAGAAGIFVYSIVRGRSKYLADIRISANGFWNRSFWTTVLGLDVSSRHLHLLGCVDFPNWNMLPVGRKNGVAGWHISLFTEASFFVAASFVAHML